MRMRLAIAAAAFVATFSVVNSVCLAQIRQTTSPPTTKPAIDPADIPVKEVVLFSSGVGYFEHAGTVHGDAATELRFKTDQINDILKSLVLQDTDGGTIGAVGYPGLAPLARTLKSFQVDIAANPDMADLLNQLRGAKLTISFRDKAERPMTGVIVGVEKKLRAAGDKAVVESITLNLKVGRKLQSVALDQLSSIELEDATLQKELDEALAAVSQARDQDKKAMTLHFNGNGDRHVRIGYLVETPVWKTSYRLVFDGAEADQNAAAEKPAATAPTTRASGLSDGSHHSAKMQGWAIVENQTDNDWTDVQLSMVSGRPLSFIQDLYHAQYIPRPIVEIDNRLSLRPQTYASGVYDIRDLITNAPDFTDAPDLSLNSTRNQNQGGQGGGGIGAGGGGGGGNNLFSAKRAEMKDQNSGGATTQPMDPTASIISAATAVRVGELFKYRIGSVSVARQTSAMIPIVTDDIEAERISIVNAGVLPDHPLLGARLKNNTKKYLLQGPITVIDRGGYAGDARIDDLPAGQERLISFGVDQQLLIDATDTKQTSATVTGTIAKGVLTLTYRNVMEQTYLADNKSDETRVLIIEHPRQAEYKLVTPAVAEETTAELLRFRRAIPAHKLVKFTVVQEHVFGAPSEILNITPENVAIYVTDAAIPQKVRDALAKARQFKQQIGDLDARISQLEKQVQDLDADQKRIRENLKAVAAESDYYKRLMKKIDAEETELEAVQKSGTELVHSRAALTTQLKEYVAGLSVE